MQFFSLPSAVCWFLSLGAPWIQINIPGEWRNRNMKYFFVEGYEKITDNAMTRNHWEYRRINWCLRLDEEEEKAYRKNLCPEKICRIGRRNMGFFLGFFFKLKIMRKSIESFLQIVLNYFFIVLIPIYDTGILLRFFHKMSRRGCHVNILSHFT